ncbi:MAG: nuclear transport factor 2 family protein [Acidobacteriia bacterium]|nr:nuclear transport factor 2 family protein [Terriglobia bacterium]
MRYNRRRGLRMFAVAALLPMMALAQSNAQAQKPAANPQDSATVQQVTQLVRDFLANVPKNDPKVFQEFFADDVIYTRATGLTVTKADILKNIDVRATSTPEATFEADDFTVHAYDNMAVVNFRLIGHNVEKDKPTTYFRNTGTFLKRHGKWQVVAWQATKAPETSK